MIFFIKMISFKLHKKIENTNGFFLSIIITNKACNKKKIL